MSKVTTPASIDEPRGISLLRAVALSLASTLAAALVASCAFVIFDFLTSGALGAPIAMTPVALLFVFTVGSIIAVPCGLVVGAPIVWTAQGPIARHPIVFTIVLALLGCALAYPIEQALEANSVQRGADLPLYLIWGAVVGGMHGLAVCWTLRRSTVLVTRSAIVAMLAVPIVAISVTHLFQNDYASQGSCDSAVVELDHNLARRADKALAPAPGDVDRITAITGGWTRFDEGSSRAHSYSAIFVNGQRAIAINDEAFLPRSLLTDFGFASAVGWRCTDRYSGPHANLVRHFSKPVRLTTPKY
ncbi:hypothetical protein [Sphingomonas sp. UYP23]